MEKIEDIIRKEVFEKINEEKETLAKDIISFELQRIEELDNAYTQEEYNEINLDYDTKIVSEVASSLANFYNCNPDDLMRSVMKGYKELEELYEKYGFNIEGDLNRWSLNVIEFSTASIASNYSEYVNMGREDRIIVRDIEVIKRYSYARDYIRSSKNIDKELLNRKNQKYLVRIVSATEKDIDDNYKLLSRLGLLQNSKGKRIEKK